jgi:hypothetical protein
MSKYESHSDRELLLLTAQKMDWVANEFMDFRRRQEDKCKESLNERKMLFDACRALEKRIDGWQNRVAGASAVGSLTTVFIWEWIKRKFHV